MDTLFEHRTIESECFILASFTTAIATGRCFLQYIKKSKTCSPELPHTQPIRNFSINVFSFFILLFSPCWTRFVAVGNRCGESIFWESHVFLLNFRTGWAHLTTTKNVDAMRKIQDFWRTTQLMSVSAHENAHQKDRILHSTKKLSFCFSELAQNFRNFQRSNV